MGPNSLRLLAELIDGCEITGRVMDLGCGRGLTTLLLANETKADAIYATDLWIPATENFHQFREWGIVDRTVPIHAEAHDLPYADGFFDAVVSIDAYHYFGCADGYFTEKFLPLLRPGGNFYIAVPGLKKEPDGDADATALLTEWAQEEMTLFHSVPWWRDHLSAGCADRVRLEVWESEQFGVCWQEWIDSGHEFAERDDEFLRRGLWNLSNLVLIRGQKLGS